MNTSPVTLLAIGRKCTDGQTVAILVSVVDGINKTGTRSYFCRIWSAAVIVADNAIDSIANAESFTPGATYTQTVHLSRPGYVRKHY